MAFRARVADDAEAAIPRGIEVVALSARVAALPATAVPSTTLVVAVSATVATLSAAAVPSGTVAGDEVECGVAGTSQFASEGEAFAAPSQTALS